MSQEKKNIKISFNKKQLIKLTDKLSFYDKGVFLDLWRFLFGEGEKYYFLTNGDSVFTHEALVQYLLENNVPAEYSPQIIIRLVQSGLLAIDDEKGIYCPYLMQQKKVSINKKRNNSVLNLNKPNVIRAIQHKEIKQETKKEEIKVVEAQKVIEVPKVIQEIKAEIKIEEKAEEKKHTSENGTLFPINIEESKENILSHIKLENPEIKIAKEIILHLNSKSGKPRGFKPKGSNLNPIIARLKDGFSQDDINMVIDFKCLQWKNTSSEAFIRPSTLFRPSNFEGYLNEAINHFKQREGENKHSLNDFINTHFKRVSSIAIQMSHEECEKIQKMCPDRALLKAKLMAIENRPNLPNSVYLTLVQYINYDKNGFGGSNGNANEPIKSRAKTSE